MTIRLLFASLLLSLAAACTEPDSGSEPVSVLTDLTAADLAAGLADGRLSASAVTRAHLDRIEALNHQGPNLRAVLTLNPDAMKDAQALDERYAQSGAVGPLHGMPVLIKGNIDVAGLVSSAGSLALVDGIGPVRRDAFLVARLREAGAVILGTSNLSEWANFRDANSSSGWSSHGGQTRNPYVLDRNPCGSSSGSAVAVAARMTPLAIGTETNGSIVCPAGVTGVVGIKPTVGLVSRSGIIPIAHTQDTAGPMARTVTDAALLLETLVAFDANDRGARNAAVNEYRPDPELTRLDGKRIGILRTYGGAGTRPRVEAIYENAIDQLQALGATLVDPIEYERTADFRPASYRILLREFKAGLNAYLAGRSLPADRDSLADLIAYNAANAEAVMPIFGQSIFHESMAISGLDDPEYAADIALAQEALRTDLENLFETHQLDALFMPGSSPAWTTDWVNGDHFSFGGTAYLAAVAGWPAIALPAGTVSTLPVSVGFAGLPDTEAELIQMAYALEQSLPPVPAPGFTPTLESP